MKRLTLEIPSTLDEDLNRICRESGMTKANVIRLSIALFNVCHGAKNAGCHVGFVKPNQADRLDTLIVGIP